MWEHSFNRYFQLQIGEVHERFVTRKRRYDRKGEKEEGGEEGTIPSPKELQMFLGSRQVNTIKCIGFLHKPRV